MAKKKKKKVDIGNAFVKFTRTHNAVSGARKVSRQETQNNYLKKRATQPTRNNFSLRASDRSEAPKALRSSAGKAYRTFTRAVQSNARKYNKTADAKLRRQLLNRNDKASKAGRSLIRKLSKSSAGRATLGATKGLASGVTLGLGEAAAKAEGYKSLSDYQRKNTKYHALTKKQEKKLKSSKAYKRGETVGDVASYMVGYGAAGKATAKAAAKVVGSKTGKRIVERAAERGAESLGKGAVKAVTKDAAKGAAKTARKSSSVVGKTVAKIAKADVRSELKAAAEAEGKRVSRKELAKQAAKKVSKMSGSEVRKYTSKAANRVATNLAKDAVADATVGIAMDTASEVRKGNTPNKKQYWIDMLGNTAANLAIGGAMDTLPEMAKGLRGSKGKTKTVERLVRTSDGKYKVKRVKVAANEGEEAVTHSAEHARNSARSQKGARTRRINRYKAEVKKADEPNAIKRYSDWQKANKESIDRLESLRKKASGGDADAAKEYNKLSETLSKSRDKALNATPKEEFSSEARRKLTQRAALKDTNNTTGTLTKRTSIKDGQKTAASMLKETDFVDHLKREKITIKDIRERAAKNGTSLNEEMRKEHQRFTAGEVRKEFEAKKAAGESSTVSSTASSTEPTVSSTVSSTKAAASNIEQPKYSTSKVVEDNLSDEARGYLKEHNLTAEDVTNRSEGMSDEAFAKEVSDGIEQRALNDAKGDMDAAEDALERYRQSGAADRKATTSNVAQNAENAPVTAETAQAEQPSLAGETPEAKAARLERENDMTFEKGMPKTQEELERTLKNAEDAGGTAGKVQKEAEVTAYYDKAKNRKQAIRDFFNDLNKKWIDSAAGVAKIAKDYNDRFLDATFDAVRRRASRTDQLVNGKGFYNEAGERVGKSLREVFEPVSKNEETWKEYQRYAYRLHDIDRTLQNKPVFTNALDERAEKNRLLKEMGLKKKLVKDGKKTVAQYPQEVEDAFQDMLKQRSEESGKIADDILKEHPEFEQVQKDMNEYIHNVNMMKVKSGIMSKEQLDYLEKMYPNYVPTHRLKYMDKSSGFSAGGRRVAPTDNIMSARGSDADLAPMQDQLAAFTSRAVNASSYNDFANRLLNDFNSKAVIKDIEPIDAKKAAEVVSDTEVRSAKNAADTAEDAAKKRKSIFDVELKDIAENNAGEYTMIAKQGDVAYRFTVNKDVFDAVKALQEPITDSKLLKGANNIFRNLVTTWNPAFPIRNGVKDFLDGASYSQYGTGAFLKNYVQSWKLMMSNSDLWKMYKNLSGTGNTCRTVAEDISAKGFERYEGKLGRVPWAARKASDVIETINSVVEQAPRFCEFITTLEKEGNSPDAIRMALYNANEITENFNRSGTMGRWVNANGATFFNAGVQDVARTVKLVKDGHVGKLLYTAGLMGIAPSVINEALCGDDPNYQRLRTQDKDVNFYIPYGDGQFLKIPKGRITGTIASVPQRLVREAMGNTDKSEKWYTGVGKSAVSQTAPNNPLKSNLAAPFIDSAITNNDSQGMTWYGTPVVSSSMSKKPQREQYDENTTELAKWLGDKLNKSPEKIDYIIKQSSGAIGQNLPATPGVGSIAKTGSGNQASALANIAKNYITSQFTTDTATNNKRSSDFYDRLGKLEENANSQNATQYDKMVYSYMNGQSQNFKAYSDQITKIETNKNLSAQNKLKKIRKLRLKQTAETERTMTLEKDYKRYYNKYKDDFKASDYSKYKDPEGQAQKELNAKIKRSIAIKHGTSPVEYDFHQLSKDQQKGWGAAKKAGVSRKSFMKYKVEQHKAGTSTLSKTFSAMDAGAKNMKQANALISRGKGKISQSDWDTAKTLKKNGLGIKNIRKYHKYDSGVSDTNYAAHAYAAIKAGAHNYDEAVAISGKNIYGTTWDTAVYAYKNGVKMKEMKNLFSDKTINSMSSTAKNGNKYRTKQGVYNWIMKHHGNDSLEKKRMYWSIYAYRNWNSMF